MLLVGDAFRNQNQQTDPYTVPWHTYGDWETKAPKQYKPRLSQVGQHSRKFFLLDGARYVTDDEIWDYDTTPTAIGSGSFSSSGPVYRDSQEYGLTKPGKFKSYRHASGEVLALNAAFFDGHVEWMTETQTRYHGYSMPTGSTLWRGAQMTPETLSILAGAYRVGDVLPD
jgi:prepilin-type processing-associated H-X9-DG protein